MSLVDYKDALNVALKVAGEDAPIVGGQALAIWANVLGIDALKEFPDTTTRDLDFVGGRAFVDHYIEGLAKTDIDWTIYRANIDADAGSPNVAKITTALLDQDFPFEIDILVDLPGLPQSEINSRAIGIVYEGHQNLLIHPVDLALSRINNILFLPSRRSIRDHHQAALAKRILNMWLMRMAAKNDERVRRALLTVANEIYRFSRSANGIRSFAKHQIDLMDSIPVEHMPEKYRMKQHPRATADIRHRRERHILFENDSL